MSPIIFFYPHQFTYKISKKKKLISKIYFAFREKNPSKLENVSREEKRSEREGSREKFSIIESSCAGNRANPASCPFLSLITNNIQTGLERGRRRRRRRDSRREMYTRVEKCWVGKRSWAGSSSRTTRDFHRQTESCRMKPARKMNKIMKEGKIFESVDDDRRKRKRRGREGRRERERSAVSVVWQQGDETWWKNESNREGGAFSRYAIFLRRV